MDSKTNKTLTILFGISGSGKTAFRNKFLKDHPDTKVINMDNIRIEMGCVDFNQSKNHLVAQEAQTLLDQAFTEGKSVIWDNTTLSAKYLRAVYEKMPDDYTLEILYMERSYDPEACIRDIKFDVASGIERSNVPEDVVMKQYERFQRLISWILNESPNYVAKSLNSIQVW